MSAASVLLVDLQAQHREVAAEVEEGFARVLGHGRYVLGEEVATFEAEFARFSGVDHCAGVANGTDALELALRAAGVGPGDEVILPVNTFIATALAVTRAGATPVLVDCDPSTYLIDVRMIGERVTRRTKAIVPVHLYGQMAEVEAIAELARSIGVAVIEDAAQAQGARRNGAGPGAHALAAATSFYPGKNLGAYGDGGAVLTTSAEVDGRIRALRNYGSDVKYHHPLCGFNSRLDTLQAVVLTAKLRRLAAWNEARNRAARFYDELLHGLDGVVPPATLPGNEHVWHLFVVRVARRDAVRDALAARGIEAGVHYPIPIHVQGALRSLGYAAGDFPVAEAAAKEILSLPLHPHITSAQQEAVVDVLRAAIA